MPELDFVRLSFRPDLQTLFMRWSRVVTSAEHRAGYNAALTLAQQYAATHWLVDLRSRGLAARDDFAWLLADFRAEMVAVLPGRAQRIAYLVTPYHYALIAERLQQMDAEVPAPVRELVVMRIFTEEAPAQGWLDASIISSVSTP